MAAHEKPAAPGVSDAAGDAREWRSNALLFVACGGLACKLSREMLRAEPHRAEPLRNIVICGE
jgi:hypothetical protein